MAGSAEKLHEYRTRRDFRKTPEPRGRAASEDRSRYVIQKHDARRLHFDLRLEHDGVLLSWAVTRGPSLDPSVKRLAVRTEDHPLEYAEFEGVIPAGYGAGTVMLWDTGSWTPHGDVAEGLDRGVLKFTLDGQRLHGGWALVKMKAASRKGRENWLLIKEKDDAADRERDPRSTWTRSVKSRRSMAGIARSTRRSDGDAAPPAFTRPQLATLADRPPEGDEWIHELKLDGYRIQALVSGERVRLMTRNGKDWTQRYPRICEALAGLGLRGAALDGEIVALSEDGRSDFSALQAGDDAPLFYYAFDLLHADGDDLRGKTLETRKQRLETLLSDAGDPVRYCEHVDGRGDRVLERACDMALEGVVSKRRAATYRSGRQSSWVKTKCVGRDEFVIGGYRASRKPGRPFASLLVGEYEGDRLVYRGRVGTGFSSDDLDSLGAALARLARRTSPLAGVPAAAKRDASWVTPRLVAEVAYTERTAEGLLRHPSFLGLREDKAPRDVAMTARSAAGDHDQTGDEVVSGISISHPQRVVFPDAGVRKRDVARWYDTIAERMLVWAGGRPAALVRCPSGLDGDCFFQKHAGSLPDEIDTVSVAERSGRNAPHVLLDSREALVAAAQMGMIEVHTWGARADRIERPDRLTMDLDPDVAVDFETVKDAAREIHEVLAAAGLESFPLLTGGKGIHLVVPLVRRQGWQELAAFARGLARQLEKAAPERYVSSASKQKRRNRIFIDWMRNRRGATAIAPFSLRARPGAPIATPISWKELVHRDSGAEFTLDNIAHRLKQRGRSPWAGYQEIRQSISRAVLEHVT